MNETDRLIQNLFVSQQRQLRRSRQPLKNLKAIESITCCRTKAMGVSYYSCPARHEVIEQTHSCNHRSCFLCSGKRRRAWIDAQRRRLFNVPHFHVVFTLPHEYLSLWRYNEAWFSRLLSGPANRR